MNCNAFKTATKIATTSTAAPNRTDISVECRLLRLGKLVWNEYICDVKERLETENIYTKREREIYK